MIDRFTGPSGRQNVIDVLLRQAVLGGDREAAERLADAGSLVQLDIGSVLIEQNASDDDIYFIIHGSVDVLVNGQTVATRTGGEPVGEMAAVDLTAKRSATVRVSEHLTAWKVPGPVLRSIRERSKALADGLQHLTAQRMRQRNRFHLSPNEKPILFIGSSSETLEVARAVEAVLKGQPIEVRVWDRPGLFSPSGFSIDSLLTQCEAADFALMVFGPDDMVASRGRSTVAPRDNVVFELGLFMGRLGRTRAFILVDGDAKPKGPSDLLGVTELRYHRDPVDGIQPSVRTACDQIAEAIAERGVVVDRMHLD